MAADTGTAGPPEVTDLAAAIQRAWDKEFSRPFSDGIDYRQARIAAETVAGLLARPAEPGRDVIHDPRNDWCACEPNGPNRCGYRLLADAVIDAFNPPDGEDAEVSICIDAVNRARDALAAAPCSCTPEMIEDWDQCPRCAALGQRGGKAVER